MLSYPQQNSFAFSFEREFLQDEKENILITKGFFLPKEYLSSNQVWTILYI